MIYKEDMLLHPITYDGVELMARNLNPARGVSLRDEFIALLKEKAEVALELFDETIDEFLAQGEEEDENPLTEAQTEALAREIYQLLRDHKMWIDVNIYCNGKRMGTGKRMGDGTWYARYNGLPFIEKGVDPRDYFEYVGPTLSMSFEGPMYDAINYYEHAEFVREFDALLRKYGMYYELGNAWNLSVYPI